MKNSDLLVVIIVLLVIFGLVYKIVPIFIGSHLESKNYVIGNDYCEVDGDCVFVNIGDCACNFIAINKEHRVAIINNIKDWDNCELFCERPLGVKCVENKCEVVEG